MATGGRRRTLIGPNPSAVTTLRGTRAAILRGAQPAILHGAIAKVMKTPAALFTEAAG